MGRKRATTIGFGAVLLWALLALLTVGSAPVPPLQLNAVSFGIGGGVGLVWMALNRDSPALLRGIPAMVWVLGIGGLAGYHFLYFSALRMAPPAQAGLIAYLWPLLIVLFSGLLPGERLRGGHLAGAGFAFAGAALIILRDATGFGSAYTAGYALASLAAITWAGYSVLSRVAGRTPTASVVVFCLGTSLLSLGAHLAFEETQWPQDAQGWLSMLGLGLGPVGAAFYLWDVGVKKGDIQLLGVASYAAPLLSTLILVAAGVAAASWTLLLAASLITGGAALAARASR
ncbi:aromatic amino acid exporter YddG [Brevirhabdus sp.]|uniref:aromatic amino acid exporter YddG n=1 Tax=Brevirhabdus sp. TaxID=2004514 RepID=UPI004059B28C